MVDTADTIFSNVIHVDVPDGQVPPVDPSLRRMKDAAREEYASWIKTHIALTMLFKLDDAKAIAGCLLAPNPACLLEVLAVIQDVDHSRAPFEDWIEGIVLGEVMQTAKKWGAIWKDPADPDFDTLPALTARPRRRSRPAAAPSPTPSAPSPSRWAARPCSPRSCSTRSSATRAPSRPATRSGRWSRPAPSATSPTRSAPPRRRLRRRRTCATR